MFNTILLAATLAQMGSGGGLYPPSSSDFGKLGTPMGGVIPGGDPGRDRSPLSGSGGSTYAGGSSSSSSGSNGWSGASGGSGTSGTSSDATESAGGGGTGTTTSTRTAGGTSSGGTMR